MARSYIFISDKEIVAMRFIAITFTLAIAAFGAIPPTQCWGQTDGAPPIAFADRPGEPGACVIKDDQVETQTVCKLMITPEKITAYYEIGERLAVLRGKKASREILLSPTVIKAIRYHKETRDNSTARILNTVRFGPLGGLLTRDKKVAEIAIDYIMPPPQPLALKSATAEFSGAIGSANPEPKLITLRIVVRRKTGQALRQQLEQSSGLTADLPVPAIKK
jgi:hypothetical protein